MKINLIAHTQLSEEFLESLSSIHLPTDGQAVALTAIRCCYSANKPSEIVALEGEKYFKKAATDGKGGTDADRLFRHIVNSGHCYDDKTEVLTDKGFVLFKDLKPYHKVAMVDENGVFAGFTEDYLYVEYDNNEHEGYIYNFESQSVSFGVTSKHRMFISPGRYLKKWEIKMMEDIDYKEYRVAKVPKKRENPPKKTSFSKEQLQFIGFFIGDGSASSSKRIVFHLKKEREKLYLENLLQRLDGVIKWEKKESYEGRHKYIVFVDFINPYDFYINGEKTLNGLHLLEGEEFEALFDGLLNSDGSYTKSNNAVHYCTNSKTLEEELCTLLTINGIAHKKDGFGRISIQKGRNLYPFVRDSRHPDQKPKKVRYTGKTYCVQVPTGILVVRRNDKTLVCGNTSTLEHLSFTFAIEGVSRALLAQLTRHRVGFSYSVQSQRYVRFGSDDKSGGFDYVVPESIRGDGAKESLFIDTMIGIQHNYDLLRKMGVPPEDARMILPNAATTNLVMTANLRALLDFYSKRRKGRGAQAEIAELAEQLRKAVVEVEPWTDAFFEQA